MKNIFLTGEKGIGKSTIIKKVIEEFNFIWGGYITQRKTRNNIKYFSIKSLSSGRLYPFARVDLSTLEKDINIDSFKYDISRFLKEDLNKCHAIILDELGSMENNIETFTKTIYEILDRPMLVVGVLKDFDCEFLNNIRERKDSIIIRVKEDNRDHIYDEIHRLILDFKF